MKKMRGLPVLVGVLLGVTVFLVSGEDLEITSFKGNGQLSWTNPADPAALYRVEWAARPGGPWYRTFDNIGSLDGHDSTDFSVDVPMYYRVAMSTEPPPRGMVYVDAGEFAMGEEGVAEPVHINFISGFWIEEKEVTKALWDKVYQWAIHHGYSFSGEARGKGPDHPVHYISWYDIMKWCNARSEMEGLVPMYRVMLSGVPVMYRNGHHLPVVLWDENGYRLPTEAEWEKAARGRRQGRRFPWGGDVITHEWANYNSAGAHAYDQSVTQDHHPYYSIGSPPYTSPCGVFPANGYGLQDMAGNVAEWVWDQYIPYTAEYRTDPRPPAEISVYRVIRGGSWSNEASFARVAHRINADAVGKSDEIGFRTVRCP